MDRNMIYVASGGALMDKTPVATIYLISNMASNTQQFGTRGAVMSRIVNKVNMIDNLSEATTVRQHQMSVEVKVCGICTFGEHPIDMCPTLQKTGSNNAMIVGSIGGYKYDKQPYPSRQYDGEQYQPSLSQGKYTAQRFESVQIMPLSIADSKIPNTTISTTATTIGSATRQFTFDGRMDEVVECENLPSQMIPNPEEGMSIVSLRSGRELPQ
ncbi:hypothetical protein CR513_48945, partial [Mucuna pruriens]